MEETEQTFISWDGAELFYRKWVPDKPTDKALLLFHRGHEHSGRWQETVDSLDLGDVAIFAWDTRGHGHSPGKRGAANGLLDVIKDVDCFARHISKEHGIPWENMIVLAHSLAAVTVAVYIFAYTPLKRVSTFNTLVGSATYTWNPSTGNTVTIPLPSGTSDQYIELNLTANSVQNGAQISELELFGP